MTGHIKSVCTCACVCMCVCVWYLNKNYLGAMLCNVI